MFQDLVLVSCQSVSIRVVLPLCCLYMGVEPFQLALQRCSVS